MLQKRSFYILLDENASKHTRVVQQVIKTLRSRNAHVRVVTSLPNGSSSNFKVTKDVFILAGCNFELLEEFERRKMSVFGLAFALQLLSGFSAFPDLPTILFADYLSPFCFTTTGLSVEDVEVVVKKVAWLGGRCEPCLTSSTTHLLSDRCDPTSAKYTFAMKNRLPVIHPRLLDDLLSHASQGIFSVAEHYWAKKFAVRVFSGCTFDLTEVNADDLDELIQLITGNGGLPCLEITDQGRSTHVVIYSNRLARRVGSSKPVTVDWIRRCVSEGYRLPEDEGNDIFDAENIVDEPEPASEADTCAGQPDCSVEDLSMSFSTMSFRNDLVFYVSSSENVLSLEPKISALGGKVFHRQSGNGNNDGMKDVDAVLTSHPRLTPATTEAIVRGIPLVHPDFISSSAAQSRFLPFDNFEFGSPTSPYSFSDFETATLVRRAYFWRLEIVNHGRQPFNGWQAIVVGGTAVKDVICLIEAGGGVAKSLVEVPGTHMQRYNMMILIEDAHKIVTTAALKRYRHLRIYERHLLQRFLFSDDPEAELEKTWPKNKEKK